MSSSDVFGLDVSQTQIFIYNFLYLMSPKVILHELSIKIIVRLRIREQKY
ncbi:12327_t:CDS:2 [Funneliformis mosseae]|uniref:12327_t:CDS:1 n=1 Tax=Funneliformis mosseae TaxID=27381 RepID=A0A9N8V9F0_FUNMO|nr:12327_t:CDS:2 [Funneliformis mosseae]